MLDWVATLDGEAIAGGLVGLSMLGVIARNALIGWAEARHKINREAATDEDTSEWGHEQVNKALFLLDRIAVAMELQVKHIESIAESQGVLANQFQKATQHKLNQLLEKIEPKSTVRRRT